MQRIFCFWILLSISSISRSQNLGFHMEENRDRVEIPIEVINNMIVIPIVLNEQIPLKFILDTGVRTTILTQKTYADILNLNYSKRYTISGAGGKKLVDAYVTNNVTLDLPGIHGAGHAMLVLENDYLELRNYLGADVQGILGYELFSRFVVQVDYEKKRLTLWQPENFKPKRRYQHLPIKVQDTKPYVITSISLGGQTTVNTKLLIDTGAGHGLILEPETDEKIKVPEKNIESVIGRGLGGEITGKIARIKSFNFGKYTLKNILANFPNPDSYSDTLLTSARTHRNGAIGGEVLSRFTLIFDYPNEEIYFKKNNSFRKDFNYNLSGMILKAKGARLRNYEISNVRADSPAEKCGIQKGDLIMVINGVATSTLDLNTVNGFFNSKPGKRIILEIEREGVRMKKEFRLEDPI